jgi:hypothetical protein
LIYYTELSLITNYASSIRDEEIVL